jgi:hypothetical protein
MTADARLTDVEWEDAITAIAFGEPCHGASVDEEAAGKSAVQRLRADRAALVARLAEAERLLMHAAQRNHPDLEGCSACAAIRAFLAGGAGKEPDHA